LPNLLVRNLEQRKLDALKARAAKKGRSVQQELHAIVDDAIKEEEYLARKRRAYENANRLKEELRATGRNFGDSTLDVRADRDSGYGHN
jgi:plasmid stability protein